MKSKHLYLSGLFLLISYLTLTAFAMQEEKKEIPNKELIKFSHTFHMEIAEDCVTCHTGALEAESLNSSILPTMENCGTCHDVEDDEECGTCHYEDVFEAFPEKSFAVKFNHKFHVTEQNMECTTCHSGVPDVEYASDSPKAFPEMAVCSDCHNSSGPAFNACESCHTSTANLIPQNHVVANFATTHKFAADDQKCAVCHETNFCEDCHNATSSFGVGNTAEDFYTPYSPRTFIDGNSQQQITKVHDLNFRYSHGIEAKANSMECRTCHQTESFCVECHTTGDGDYLLGGVLPQSHQAPNFTTLGVGSGGGEHANFARRDIESCIACHDIEGGDPTCITCHFDNDGLKGTNPKTHESGFMSDFEGDWHESVNSVCFDCHTDAGALTQTKGQGFCGYCHN